MSTINPYSSLGLSHNPFVAEAQPGVADHLWLDRGHSSPIRSGSRSFVQFIGPKGAGKTSHLLRWQSHTGGPYLHVPPDLRRWRVPPQAPIAYWDEADRIPGPWLLGSLWCAARMASTVVVGTHRDLGAQARRFGFNVHTIELEQITAADVIAWAQARIDAVGLDAQPTLKLEPERADGVAAQAQGSWRAVATALHIWAAECAARASTLETPSTKGPRAQTTPA